MEYIIQISNTTFRFTSPIAYPWTQKDQPFMLSSGSETKGEIQCHIHWVKELVEPTEPPVFTQDGVSIWNKDDEEIRSYKALFYSGQPLYAISKSFKKQVDIIFLSNYSLWNHPNMLLWSLIHLENYLLHDDALILHSCYTQYQQEGILFTAPSGTGKTTQATIWKRVYGSQIVNGDKCVLQKTTSGWKACGFPMSGSAPECENKSFPLKAIVIVRQSTENYIQELPVWKQVSLLYSECTVNSWNALRVQKSLALLTELTQKIPVLMLHCNMEDQAAQVLHEYLYK